MYDVIVVGVGGMGSATVYQLARRHVRVLGLERFDIPNDRGSSHGMTRIIRLAYFEHPSYVPLLRRAYELWRDVEHQIGEQLLFTTGSLDIGAEAGAFIGGSERSCRDHQLTYELLTAEQLRARWPAYQMPSTHVALFQPNGGFLLPERCIVAHVNLAHAMGADIHAREQVLRWEASNDRVTVWTTNGEYAARRLILTAGPWTGQLVPALAAAAIPERQVVLWVHPRRPELFAVGAFPVFNLDSPLGRFYGFPIYGVPGFKIGKYHHLHETGEADRLDRDVHPRDEAIVREAVRAYFPDADGPTMAMKPCMFTNTADEHFILDYHPDTPAVAIAAGFSGHGFKFCSIIGEIMADLALDGGTRWDLEMFRLARLARR